MQIKPDRAGARHTAEYRVELQMTTNEFYFLLLVISSFLVFGVGLASAYIRYRRWIVRQPPHGV